MGQGGTVSRGNQGCFGGRKVKGMEEVQYYKTVYSKFWKNQTKKYGYTVYEQNLVRLIARSLPKCVFEVGIGTGWPIGTALKERGIRVDGCDIAENSVALAQKELENTKGIWTGDVMDYKGEQEVYDVVYCVRASWYIPDFYKTVSKMVSMTKSGGVIIFDVMDQYSPHCIKVQKDALKDIYFRFLGIHVEKQFGQHFICLWKMKRFLKNNGLSYQCWREREITHNTDWKHTPKVVFCCRKER